MECPQCQHTPYIIGRACPACGFNPEPDLAQKLANLLYLLHEIDNWADIPPQHTVPLQVKYTRQLQAVEIELGLRPAFLTTADLAHLHRQLGQQTDFLTHLAHWEAQGWLTPDTAARLRQHALGRQRTLLRHLGGDTPPPFTPEQALANQQYRLDLLERLAAESHITPTGYEAAVAAVHAEQVQLAPPVPEAPPTAEPAIDIILTEAPTKPQKPRPTPREPWTWDKVWDSLLSERTLKAVLFLAVSLLFGGAVSIVVNEWQNFPPAAQAAFLVGFTAVFYGLGWYVRQRMHLEGSGIALTAAASLLVPLDFYTFYISGGFPAGSWPTVWLAASAVCLVAYTATALALRAEFFGYFIAVAATSLITAALNWGDVAWQWWQVPPVALAILLQLQARSASGRFSFLQRPFQHMALGLIAPTLGSGLMVALFANPTAAFDLPVAVAWWLGCGVLLLAIPTYPHKLMVTAALIAPPIAVALTQNWLFHLAGIPLAWQGMGLALVAAVYWVAGAQLKGQGHSHPSPFAVHHAQFAIFATLLVGAAAVVALTQLSAAAVIHTLLALIMVLASGLWQRPRWLWAASLLAVTATAAAQAYGGATIPELAVPWASLSLLYVFIALRLPPKRHAYRAVVVQASIVTAGLALLPPLLLSDLRLLTYTLGHWIGLAGWLGYLVASRDWELGESTFWNHPALWHALAAVPAPIWLFLVGRNASGDGRIVAQAVAGWLIFALGLRLRRVAWPTHRPWRIATHLNTVLMCILVGQGVAIWPTVLALLATAVLYFTLAHPYRWSWWLAFGVGFANWGVLYWLSDLDGGNIATSLTVFAGLAVAITAAGGLSEGWRGTPHAWLKPLYWANSIPAGLVFLLVLTFAALEWNPATDFIQLAAVALLLASHALLYAWLSGYERWGHAAVWLVVLAGGLALKVYSHGSGRAAWLAAVLACAYVGAERILHAQAVRPTHGSKPSPWQLVARRAWRLGRRPLLWGGWGVSGLAIAAALVRNLILLGGGPTRQLWSIAALATVTALYIACAYWFGKVRWAWAAVFISTITYGLAADWLFDALARATDATPWAYDPWRNAAWVVWGFILLATAVVLAQAKGKKSPIHHSQFTIHNSQFLPPPLWAAQLIVLWVWLAAWSGWTSVGQAVTLGLATLFYATAAVVERRLALGRSRMLYPASLLAIFTTLSTAAVLAPHSGDLGQGVALLMLPVPALLFGRWLRRWDERYPLPLSLLAHGALWLGFTFMPNSGAATLASLFGVLFYGLATAVHGRAGWLNFSTGLLGVALMTFLDWLGVPFDYWGLILFPAVVVALGIGRWLEEAWGWQGEAPPPFPRHAPTQWPLAAWQMVSRWWAFPFYAAGLAGVVWLALLTAVDAHEAWPLTVVLAAGTAVWLWSMVHFKWRLYLLAAGVWGQLTAVCALLWLGWPATVEPFGLVMSFVTLATAVGGLLIEHALNEGPPWDQAATGWWRGRLGGWSRMLYLLVAVNIGGWELLSLITFGRGWPGGMTLIHALIVALLATVWLWPFLMYVAQVGVLMALLRGVAYAGGRATDQAIAITCWAVALGVVGYGLPYLGRKMVRWPARVGAWIRPLQIGSWVGSLIALAASLSAVNGTRASAEMLVLNLALIGLLYVAVAVAEQRPRLAHVALLLLLTSWSIWLAAIQRQDEIQLYALPASAYLLAVGWVEWRYGSRKLAVLIDYTGFVLLLGSVLWQAFGVWGGLYALLMLGEGLGLVWLGSARRMRRHLYAGVTAVLLAIISQILEPLFNLNAFVLLLLGGSLVVLGIALERRLEAVRVLTKGFSQRLEDWD